MSTQTGARTARCLGAAFVSQFVTSLAAGILSGSLLTGSIAEVLANVSGGLGQLRAIIALELLTSVGILLMTALLYVVLRDQNRAAALVALALWVAEAVLLAVKTLGLYALLTLGERYVGGGTPTPSEQTLGTLSWGFSQHAADIAMLVFCLGGLLWYFLLLESRIVPRLLPLWGLTAVPLVLVATLMLVWDRSSDPSIALYALYVPFELVLGLWLLVKGADVPSNHARSTPSLEESTLPAS